MTSNHVSGAKSDESQLPTLKRLHQANVAELVASALRKRILDGELTDGSLLPKQEELSAQFGTSPPSVREGLRILEGEGLVTVRRGRLGGAVVHAPAGDSAAYMLGLVFQSRKVRIDEIGVTLNDLEPICAGLCAERKDRRETVVPQLRAIRDAALVPDLSTLEQIRLGRRFHEVLVENCGRETMVILIGVLSSIWSAHTAESAQHGILAKKQWSADYQQGRNDDHEELIDLIDQGDSAAAIISARRHLETSTFYQTGGRESRRTVEADLLARYMTEPKT